MRRVCGLLLLVLGWMAAAPMSAQTPIALPMKELERGTAQIKGVLVDKESSKPIVGMSLVLAGYEPTNKLGIVAISVEDQFPPKVTTDKDGKFSFAGLPAGTYVIMPSLGGFGQLDSLLTFKQGALSTHTIAVKKGQSVDLGKVQIVKK